MTHNIIKVHIEKSSSPIGNGVKEIEIMTFSQKREGGEGGGGGGASVRIGKQLNQLQYPTTLGLLLDSFSFLWTFYSTMGFIFHVTSGKLIKKTPLVVPISIG